MMIEKEIYGLDAQIDADSLEAIAFAESVARAYANKAADIAEYLSKDEALRFFSITHQKKGLLMG